MARFKFTFGCGFVGGDREEEVEIDDEQFEGMDEKEREDYIEEEYQDWKNNFLDGGWHEITEDE